MVLSKINRGSRFGIKTFASLWACPLCWWAPAHQAVCAFIMFIFLLPARRPSVYPTACQSTVSPLVRPPVSLWTHLPAHQAICPSTYWPSASRLMPAHMQVNFFRLLSLSIQLANMCRHRRFCPTSWRILSGEIMSVAFCPITSVRMNFVQNLSHTHSAMHEVQRSNTKSFPQGEWPDQYLYRQNKWDINLIVLIH